MTRVAKTAELLGRATNANTIERTSRSPRRHHANGSIEQWLSSHNMNGNEASNHDVIVSTFDSRVPFRSDQGNLTEEGSTGSNRS
jgi:hypothetical protein